MEKILVVNNDVDMMSLLKSLLEKKAYKVTYTSSRDEGLKLAKKISPGLVMVDILHKDLLPLLKKDEETRNIPLMLMTGYSLRDPQVETLADDVIEKPFEPGLLMKKIQKHMMRGQSVNI